MSANTNIQIPPALQKKLGAIDLEVQNLHFKWKFFSQLFAEPERVKILNATAGLLFRSVEDAMLFDVLLSIMRLTDPKQSFGKENLSLENVISEIPDDVLKAKAEAILLQIKSKTDAIKVWRDKKLSHNDLQKSLGSFSLPPIEKKKLTDTLDHIGDIMNLIHGHYSDTAVMYSDCVTSADGDSLLFYLEYGLDAWNEDKRNHNLERVHKLRKQRTQSP